MKPQQFLQNNSRQQFRQYYKTKAHIQDHVPGNQHKSIDTSNKNKKQYNTNNLISVSHFNTSTKQIEKLRIPQLTTKSKSANSKTNKLHKILKIEQKLDDEVGFYKLNMELPEQLPQLNQKQKSSNLQAQLQFKTQQQSNLNSQSYKIFRNNQIQKEIFLSKLQKALNINCFEEDIINKAKLIRKELKKCYQESDLINNIMDQLSEQEKIMLKEQLELCTKTQTRSENNNSTVPETDLSEEDNQYLNKMAIGVEGIMHGKIQK